MDLSTSVSDSVCLLCEFASVAVHVKPCGVSAAALSNSRQAHTHAGAQRQGLEGAVVVMIKYGFVLLRVKLRVVGLYAEGLDEDEEHSSHCCLLSNTRTDHQRRQRRWWSLLRLLSALCAHAVLPGTPLF